MTLQEEFDGLIAAVKSGHTQSREAFLAMMNFIAQLGEGHDRLQQLYARLEEKHAQLKEDYADTHPLWPEIQKLRKEHAEAKMHVSARETQLAHRERDLKDLREQNLRLKDDYENAKIRVLGLEIELAERKEDYEREETCTKNKAKIVQDLAESRAEGEFLRSEKARLEEDRLALQRSLTETQNQAVYYFNQYSQSAKDLAAANLRAASGESLLETTDPIERELEKSRRDLERVRKFATKAGKRLRELRELGPAPFLGCDDAQAKLNEDLGAGLVKVEDAGFTYDRRWRVIVAEYALMGEPGATVDQAIRLLTPRGFHVGNIRWDAFSNQRRVRICRS